MNADEVIGEISHVSHRCRLPGHVARDAAGRRLNRAWGLAAGLSHARRFADAASRRPGGRMALQAPRLVPSRESLRVSMGIVACHAVELLTTFFVTTAPGQRGARKPDSIGLVRREFATRLRRAMAFPEPDNGRAGCQRRTPDGEVGVWGRSKILGSDRFQVIPGRPVAPLAANARSDGSGPVPVKTACELVWWHSRQRRIHRC